MAHSACDRVYTSLLVDPYHISMGQITPHAWHAPLVTWIEIQGIFTHSVLWEKQPRDLSVMNMHVTEDILKLHCDRVRDNTHKRQCKHLSPYKYMPGGLETIINSQTNLHSRGNTHYTLLASIVVISPLLETSE
jgi:hypothetical protein